MKITDLRIGDRVRDKVSKFPMTVIGIYSDSRFPITSGDKGTVYLDFEGNEGDVWEENIEDLELCEPRYKLPEWRIDECEEAVTSKDLGFVKLHYDISKIDEYIVIVDLSLDGRTTRHFLCKVGDSYPTLEEAKEAAEKHYNELVGELIRQLTSAHLISEASKM